MREERCVGADARPKASIGASFHGTAAASWQARARLGRSFPLSIIKAVIIRAMSP